MKKKTIINLISFIFALAAFGLYYFYFAITEYGPKSLPAAFTVSLFVAFFAGFFAYIIIKTVWLKIDSSFAVENEKSLRRAAINYFEKYKLTNGAYFETSVSKKTTGGRIYFYFTFF